MPHFMQIGCNQDAGCEIHDTLCGMIMVMLNLYLLKGKTEEESSYSTNGTETDGDDNHGR